MLRYYSIFSAIITLVLLAESQVNAQGITRNDSFEGTPAVAVPPKDWYNCFDWISTVDTQPGPFMNQKPASHGKTYVSIVTRQTDLPGTVETLWADLLLILEKEKCYSFTIDLCRSHEFYSDWNESYYDNPCILRIFGFNSDCNPQADTELLWQSDVLNNYEWQRFQVDFRPEKASYHRIAFSPFFTPPDNFKNSVVFIDNLQYRETPDIFLLQDGFLALPDGATDIHWFFNGSMVGGAHTVSMPLMGSGWYSAVFFDSEGCLIHTTQVLVEVDNIKFYPNPIDNQLFIESYASDENTCQILLYDELGRKVLEKKWSYARGIHRTELDLAAFPPAIYCLKLIRTGREVITFKAVVQR